MLNMLHRLAQANGSIGSALLCCYRGELYSLVIGHIWSGWSDLLMTVKCRNAIVDRNAPLTHDFLLLLS